MIYKIDTHENFVVLELQEPINNTSDQNDVLVKIEELLTEKNNLILNLKKVEAINSQFILELEAWHFKFYEQNCSFVICEMNPVIKSELPSDFMEKINYAPQLIEAIDIVSMEILERELLGDFED